PTSMVSPGAVTVTDATGGGSWMSPPRSLHPETRVARATPRRTSGAAHRLSEAFGTIPRLPQHWRRICEPGNNGLRGNPSLCRQYQCPVESPAFALLVSGTDARLLTFQCVTPRRRTTR